MTRTLLIVLLALTAITLLLPAVSSAQNNEWSVSAANWMQYWYHRPEPNDTLNYTNHQSRQDSLDNRFTVDFNFGDFYAGAWLRTFQPNLNTSSYEKLTQRYFGWHENGLTLHAGNFYQTFDRGLTLNAFLDDAVYFDNNLDGIKLSGAYDYFDFDALSARGYKFEGNGVTSTDRIYTLRGVRGALKPITGIKTGFSYVRLKEDSFDFIDPTDNTNMTAVNAQVNRGPIDLYGEYAVRRGRTTGDVKVEGDGTYASGSFSHSMFSIYAEYKNFINLLYPGPVGPYNAPPPVSHSGRTLASLIQDPGERGYQIGALLSPIEQVNIDISFSESYSRHELNRNHLGERYVGVRLNPIEKFVLNAHWDRYDYTYEEEVENYYDGYYYLSASQTLSFAAYTRRFWPSSADYHEDYLTLGYSRGSLIQVSIGGSLSNYRDRNEFAFNSDPEKLGFIEATLHFKSHDLMIFQGGERGGLVCSSGICSIRPTFQGTRVMLFSRF
jgi:hypothetical protein